MKALIDADIVAYRAAQVNQKPVITFDETTGEKIEGIEVNFEGACKFADSLIKRIKQTTWSDTLILCFSDASENNFRYKVLPTYKHNRIGKSKPLLLSKVREYLQSKYTYNLMQNIEADDVLGLLQDSFKDDTTVLCTVDKDLNQIVGLHYNWDRDDLYEVSKAEGDYMFYFQILNGDTGDGYKGCKGIGKVLAQKHLPNGEDILDKYEVWSRVVSLYESKGLTEADAIIQARVARMLRGNEYNQKIGEVKLWIPLTQPSK